MMYACKIPSRWRQKTNSMTLLPFGLFDIFNHLIYNSCDYDTKKLASDKLYDDYRLFDSGDGRILVNWKVQPTMRSKTHEGKDFNSTSCGSFSNVEKCTRRIL